MPDGLSLLIDNTTLHRLTIATDRGVVIPADEAANFLHLIECLILAEQLTIARFESQSSQERSDRVLEWLDGTQNRGLVQVSALSDVGHQMEIASSVALEMFERGLLAHSGETPGDLDEIKVQLGRPVGVLERASSFWEEASKLKDLQLVQDRARQGVVKYQTDGLFEFGLSQHEEIAERLVHAYENGSRPSNDAWRKMHVVFRTWFNQQLADRHEDRAYAPPPVRARVLRTVYSRTIKHLEEAMSRVTLELQSEMDNPTFAEEILEGADQPLPVLGLAYMLQATAVEGPGAPFADRLVAARELAAPMRARLSRLEQLARTGTARWSRDLQEEALMLEEATRSRLGLPHTTGLDFQFDAGVMLDANGMPTVRFGLSGSPSAVKQRAKRGLARKRISVLSDGLAHTVEHKTLADAVHSVTR
jgi:hypothetical protein